MIVKNNIRDMTGNPLYSIVLKYPFSKVMTFFTRAGCCSPHHRKAYQLELGSIEPIRPTQP